MTENIDKFSEGRRNYFISFALKHVPEMRFLFHEVRLNKSEGWGKALEHCVVVAATTDKLADLIKLSDSEKNKLVRTALCHDWKKRIELKPSDFTEEEMKKAEDLLHIIKPDEKLIKTTGTEFINNIVDDNYKPSLSEKLMFYSDEIVSWNNIVSMSNRIAETESRRQDLGKEYWEKERKVANEIEKEIFTNFPENIKVKIGQPENTALFIKSSIELEYSNYS